MPFLLSYYQVEPLIKALQQNIDKIFLSLDLGLTIADVYLKKDTVIFPDKQQLTLKQLKKIFKQKSKVFLITDNNIHPVNIFSEKTGWVRTLFPTKSAPTTLVSGILMHRIKDTDPLQDSKQKVEILLPLINNRLLDTTTGLGYTAIEAAKMGAEVTTIELDPAAIDLAKLNPWSNDLFANPRIQLINAHILEQITKFENNQFDRILHDPPTFKLAGELYSEKLYREFMRILKVGGKLFHYIGDPQSKHGKLVTRGVISRLKMVGFRDIELKSLTFGVLAVKK